MRWSIIIPAKNEGRMLAMTVSAVLSGAETDDFEILVVDDGSTDGSAAALVAYGSPRVRVLATSGQGVARARNFGAREACGEHLVFLDAHCLPGANWLDHLAGALAPRDAGVAGPAFTQLGQTSPRGCGMFWPDEALDPCWFEPREDARGAYDVPLTTGACQAFRRDVFAALGGYDAGFTSWGYEDVEICLRAWRRGWRVRVEPRAVVAHWFREARGYEVDEAEVLANLVRMACLHLPELRRERALAHYRAHPRFAEAWLRGACAPDEAGRDAEWFFRALNPWTPA